MKKIIFSGLISGSLLLLAVAQTKGQSSFGQDGKPIQTTFADGYRFFAYPENNAIIMRWSTGNETNVDHYVIEKSSDGTYFSPLHEVVSKGSIDEDSSYSDMDTYPTAQTNYYRLRTVMKDGSDQLSAVVKATIARGDLPRLHPTVLHMGATLFMDNNHDQPYTINFFNANGTLTGTFIVNSTSFEIPTNGWGAGIFFYRISDPTHPLIDAGKIMIM